MLAINTHLKNRYRILEVIGHGGFGNVYRAIDEVFGCDVAIKETREIVANRAKLRKAFEREAHLLHNLRHPALPRVSDYFFQDQAQFLVMDFIEGKDLASLLEQRLAQGGAPFAFSELWTWTDKLLDALEYLHSRPQPIIHRDIKPGNIKLTGEADIYLLDFGMAKGVFGQMSTVVDGQSSSSVAGCTRQYAPLEQLRETGSEPQSDIYSLAATLYHLMTGQRPMTATERDEEIERNQRDPLRPAHEANSAVPPSVSNVLSDGMAIRWWDRTSSAKEFRQALANAHDQILEVERTLSDPLQDASDHAARKSGSRSESAEAVGGLIASGISFRLRHGRWWLAMFLVLLVVSILAAYFYFSRRPVISAKPENPTARLDFSKAVAIPAPTNLRLMPPLQGHSGTIWSVAFSPSGDLVASASEDGTIILWDVKTWSQKFPALRHQRGAVYSVAFSLDGKTLASGGRDMIIRLWDTNSGKLIKSLPSQDGKPILRLAFSRTSNILASSSGEPDEGAEEIMLWNADNHWEPRVLFHNTSEQGSRNQVFAIAFAADRDTLATAGRGNNLQLWNARGSNHDDLRLSQPLTSFVTTIAFSADGKYLASSSSDASNYHSDTSIRLWIRDPVTHKWAEEDPINAPGTFIVSMAFSPDCRTLVVVDTGVTIRTWDLVDRITNRLQPPNPYEISAQQRSVAFAPDGQTVVTGGQDKMVHVWQ